MNTFLSSGRVLHSTTAPSGIGGNGKLHAPGHWRTDRYRDPIRYYQGENGPDSWETCKRLCNDKDQATLLGEWTEARRTLEEWMERARRVLDGQDRESMGDMLFSKTPPTIDAHLVIPPLFERGLLSREDVDAFLERGRAALSLAVRINIRYLLDHKGHPAVEHPQSVHCDYLATVAEDAGVNVRSLEEWPAYEPERAIYQARQQQAAAEMASGQSEPPRLRDTGG